MSKLKVSTYNPEVADWYLETMVDNENSKAIYKNFFDKASKMEEELGKNLYDMDKGEIERMFHSLQIRGMHSMLNTLYFCKRYILWAKSNGHASHNFETLPPKFTTEYASQFVFNAANQRYTREEVLENIKLIDDPRYSTAILCLFEGIRGHYLDELANLKDEDVIMVDENNCYVKLNRNNAPEPVKVPISFKLYNMLKHLNGVTHVGTEQNSTKYSLPMDSPFIFKKVARKNAVNDVKINTPFMTRTIINAKLAFHNNNLVANDIVCSGVAHMANELMNQRTVRFMDNEILKAIGKQFNIGHVSMGYNEESYTSYGAIKKMIDFDYIRDVYGSFDVEWENESN